MSPARGTPFAGAAPAGVRFWHTFAHPNVVPRSYKNRFRLLGVAIAGAVVGILVGYLLLTVTILRWSEQ
jgi:hypothetical protein